MKNKEKELAVKLRIEQQLSLKQISEITGLAKSTLSLLLREYPLSSERIKELSIDKQLNGAKKNKHNADVRKSRYKSDGAILTRTNPKFRDLVFLYWGEGSKYVGNSAFALPNTDPDMIKYVVQVLTDLGYSDNIIATAYCYPHSDLDEIKSFWKTYVGKDIRTYIVKNSKNSYLKRIDKQPYGTLRLEVYSTELYHNVLGGIEEIKGSMAQR